jgi:hypothetical protein
MCSLAESPSGQILNVNADVLARELAIAMKARPPPEIPAAAMKAPSAASCGPHAAAKGPAIG